MNFESENNTHLMYKISFQTRVQSGSFPWEGQLRNLLTSLHLSNLRLIFDCPIAFMIDEQVFLNNFNFFYIHIQWISFFISILVSFPKTQEGADICGLSLHFLNFEQIPLQQMSSFFSMTQYHVNKIVITNYVNKSSCDVLKLSAQQYHYPTSVCLQSVNPSALSRRPVCNKGISDQIRAVMGQR